MFSPPVFCANSNFAILGIFIVPIKNPINAQTAIAIIPAIVNPKAESIK